MFISEMQKIFFWFDLHQYQFSCFKGQSSEIFDPHFCHHSNLPGLLTNGLKYFRIWLRFCRVIWTFPNLPGVNSNTVLWGISFFEPKIRTAQRNLHQNRKYFNPLPGARAGLNYEGKKTGGRKSRWTVPIMKPIIQFSCLSALGHGI